MSDIVVLGAGFGGTYFAKAVGAPCLSRSNGHDLNEMTFDFHSSDIMQRLARERPRVVVNLASQSMVGQSWSEPCDWLQTNCVAQTSLLQALIKLPRLERYIHFTTPEVYGSTDGWVKENWNFAPSTPYAASRACGDWMVKLWHQQYGFPAVFTRAANIYGEGQQLYRLIPKAILAKLEGSTFPLEGGGKDVRAFVHMDDVTNALNLLIHHGQPGETYHISPHELATIKGVCDLAGCETRDVPDRAGKDKSYLLNSDKIMSMGWVPKVELEVGIERVRSWMCDNLSTWGSWPREYRHAA